MKTPKEWQANDSQIKSGWKHNPEVLSEIVTRMNNEEYIEDENQMMETVDLVLFVLEDMYNVKLTKRK